MTRTEDRTTVPHPDWCSRCLCTAAPKGDDRFLTGRHVSPTKAFRTIWGTKVSIDVVQDGAEHHYALDDASRTQSWKVSLTLWAHEDDVPEELRGTGPAESQWRAAHGEMVELEPEEARMFARFLVEAAAKVDQLADKNRLWRM